MPGKWRLHKAALSCLERNLLAPLATFDDSVQMFVDRDDYIQKEVFARGCWEDDTTQLVKSILHQGDIFIDVGAHVGYFSLIGSKCVGKRGKVHAFEPVPRLYSQLEANVRLNHFENLVLNNIACWSQERDLTLYEANGRNVGKSSAISRNAVTKFGPSVEAHGVKATTIDDYVERAGLLDVKLIKIDVEGSEDKVLTGGQKTIKRCNPFLIVELVPQFLETSGLLPSEFLRSLKEDRYDCRLLDWNHSSDSKGSVDEGWGNVVFVPKKNQKLDKGTKSILRGFREVT